jgi:ring-1,2-phenylacetyl-CoA epoxidase subunit PaaD
VVTATTVVDEAAVRAALAEVADPEIPVVSVVDLGMVEGVEVAPAAIRVELLPTFVGCPAIELIRAAVEERLSTFGRPVQVEMTYRVPWTSDRITDAGRERLRRSGFAPPQAGDAALPVLVQLGTPVPCPHCGSRRTVLENAFGPTQCRAIHHCTACRQPFEAFKPV